MIVVAALLVAGGLAALVFGVAERARARREILESLLEAELADPSRGPESLAELARRAGAFAERALEGTSTLDRIRLAVTRAGWSLRPGEFAALAAGAGAVAGFVLWSVAGTPSAAGLGVLLGAGGLIWHLRRSGRRRVALIEEQLPNTLQLLASSLDSGASVLHALETTASEGEAPLAGELGRVVAETQVGRPLLESLEAMATRLGSHDVTWTVEAVRIQQTTGGRLADTLRVLADFMRARIEVRGEVRALSAEARLSGHVLTALPLVLAGYFLVFRRSYIEPLYTTSMGRMMVVLAVGGLALGTVLMRRIVRKVEV